MSNFVQPPPDHMKLLVVDPGTTRSGALFVSVPGPGPDEDQDAYRPKKVHFYGEYMAYGATAREFARAIKEREGETMFYEVLMDQRAGRQRPMGFDHTVFKQYEDAFEGAGIVSMRGTKFEWASDDVQGRELLLKAWMRGPDAMLVVHPHLVNLKEQMENFFKRKEDPTKREGRKVTELIDCAEYAAAYFERGLFWYPPKKLQKLTPPDEATEVLKDLLASNWNMAQAKVRAKLRHHEQQLIRCVLDTEGEFPGVEGDQAWWPKDRPVPQGWEVLDANDQTRSQKWAALNFLKQRPGPVM